MDSGVFNKMKAYILNFELTNAELMISDYELKIKHDHDLLLIKTLLHIYKKDLDKAYSFARQAIMVNRLNLDANLNLAVICGLIGNWLESYAYYSRLFALQENFKKEIVTNDDLNAAIDQTIQKMSEHLQTLKGDEYQEYYDKMMSVNKAETDLLTNMFTGMEEMDYYFGSHSLYNNDYYFARYDDWFHSYWKPDKCMNGNEAKMEIMKVRGSGTEFVYDEEVPCIAPCIINPEQGINDVYFLNEEGEESHILDSIKKTWSYFRLDGWTRIKAEHPMVFGEPILLKQVENQKKLVFNIFLDSFNYQFFQEYPLKEIMPHTYRFFQEGIICNKAYSGSEFTYPSVPSYWTGLRPNRHKMLNSNLQFDMPDGIRLISEYYKDAGFFTSKIGGNCFVIPNLGYIKGIDRFVFEHYKQNFNAQQAVSDAIEHMAAYRDTNQFIWFEIEDLHDVAGGWQRTPFVQTRTPYSSREVDNTGGSTLYQSYSPHRREIYKEELTHIDLYLNFIYQYIKENYKKEEVVVSLISDHGNGFNIKNGQPFLSDQRMNVPMMFYCDWDGEHECNEIVETIDYLSIIAKLAGIDLSTADMDGRLPLFFGGTEKKEYAVSQSIFPNKPYVGAIFYEDKKFYLETVNCAGSDLRIDFSELKYKVCDKDDNEIADEATVRKSLGILKDLIKDFDMHISE